MPSIDENSAFWDETYDWTEQGDEWSATWGGARTQWHATLLPRLWPFLPAGSVCEIAPGYGRWTQFLLGMCDNYVGVDLAPRCVEACRQRFKDVNHARFDANDGRSLTSVADGSIDLVFSFDSLVHVEADAIADYVRELARVLKPDGMAWLHHSNLGELRHDVRKMERAEHLTRLVPAFQERLQHRKNRRVHWRARTMASTSMTDFAREAGLVCIGQEIVNWGGPRLIDCISLIARPGSKWDRQIVVQRNPNFMCEAVSAKSIATVFTSVASPVLAAEVRPKSAEM